MTSPPRRPHDHLVEPIFAALRETPDEQPDQAPTRRVLPGRSFAVAMLVVAAAAALVIWLL
jgi:hypothetical protein